jgi:uncharacterized membrane protein YhaH (DUF805 family)
MNWYLAVLKKYTVFDGRASRTEFWMFALFNFIALIVISVLGAILAGKGSVIGSALMLLYALGTLLPNIGVAIRRLHDTGRSGWWILLAFVPFIGFVVLLVFYILESQPGDNEYGPSPHPASP